MAETLDYQQQYNSGHSWLAENPPSQAVMQAVLSATHWRGMIACSGIASGIDSRVKSGRFKKLAATDVLSSQQVRGRELCVGREVELKQLDVLYNIAVDSTKGTIAYISGMSGLGKTRLKQVFLARMQAQSEHHVMCNAGGVCVEHALSPLQCLSRHLLGVETDVADGVIRQVTASLAVTQASYFFILGLTGVRLSADEQAGLDTLDAQASLYALELAVRVFVNRCVELAVKVIAIDDLHRASDDFIQLLKMLVMQVIDRPLLLLLCVTDIGRFTSPPQWLNHACVIKLRALTIDDATMVADDFIKTQAVEVIKPPLFKRHAIARADGNPRFLHQLLMTGEPRVELPADLSHGVAIQLNTLTRIDLMSAKVAAVVGQCFSAEQVYFVLAQLDKTPALCQLQTLVYVGVIKHAGADYCFQHRLIREAIVSRLSVAQHQQISILCDDFKPSLSNK